jgi:hypothetical protein
MLYLSIMMNVVFFTVDSSRLVLQCSTKLPRRLTLSETSLLESIGILEQQGNEDDDRRYPVLVNITHNPNDMVLLRLALKP